MMTRRKPNPALKVLALLTLTALACSLGSSPETTPTSVPQAQEPTLPPEATLAPETTLAAEATSAPEATPAPVATASDQLTRDQRAALIAASVQIYGLQDQGGGDLQPIYIGSGTIISPDGLILTNAHVASPASQGDVEFEPDALGILLVEREDKPPVPSYLAEVLAVDGFLDLAVVQVSSTLDGGTVDRSRLTLPYVELGDSNEIHIGDPLNIFGFPGIGGDTITFTKGSISGFTPEEGVGDRAWIKTDATIAGGNSGGLGADSFARIVGVPTQASSGAGGEVTDCRVIQDTNGDGSLDNQDTCIPIGGFINALRPIELARPLIEAAESGVSYASPFGTVEQPTGGGGSGQEQIANLRWATGADDAGNPVGIAETFPTGVSEIYAFFDFSGFSDGQDFEAEWYIEGEKVAESVFPWDGGSQGTYYVFLYSNSGALDDGLYEVALYVGDGMPLAASGQTAIGAGGGVGGGGDPQGDVTIEGLITDADTGQGIPGALFIVLQPGTDPEAWLDSGSDADIVVYAEADANGFYQVTGLQRDVHYSVVVGLDPYQPAWSDDFWIAADEPQVITVDVELQR